MNNEHTITGEDIASLAANSLINKKRKHHKREDRKPKNLYSLHATDEQVAADPRLIVISRFIEVARAKRKGKGTRCPAIRDFFISAMHDAIIAKGKKAKVDKRAIELIEARELDALNGSTFLTDADDNIALDA